MNCGTATCDAADLRRSLVRAARPLARTADDAEDLAHDAIVAALATDGRRSACGATPRQWAFGCLRQVARSARARRREEASDPDALALSAADVATPEALSLAAEARAALRAEVEASLTPRTARLLWARFEADEEEPLVSARRDARVRASARRRAWGLIPALAAAHGVTEAAFNGAVHAAKAKLRGTPWRAADVALAEADRG